MRACYACAVVSCKKRHFSAILPHMSRLHLTRLNPSTSSAPHIGGEAMYYLFCILRCRILDCNTSCTMNAGHRLGQALRVKQFEVPNPSDPMGTPIASCYRRLVRRGVRNSAKVVSMDGTIIRVVGVFPSRFSAVSHSYHWLSGALRHFRDSERHLDH